jgi:hypothetical protein
MSRRSVSAVAVTMACWLFGCLTRATSTVWLPQMQVRPKVAFRSLLRVSAQAP